MTDKRALITQPRKLRASLTRREVSSRALNIPFYPRAEEEKVVEAAAGVLQTNADYRG